MERNSEYRSDLRTFEPWLLRLDLQVSLASKVALVTGASGGLGEHFASVLAASGARVVVAARRLDACHAVCRRIRNAGGHAAAVRLDVTDVVSVRQALDEVSHDQGVPDIVVCNAGVTTTTPLIDQDAENWDKIIETNLKGCFLVAQNAARAMIGAEKGGAIVNIASILGLRVAGQVAAYSTSKAAIVQLTRSMALEWARHDIRVNTLCPGYIETDLNRDFFTSSAGQALVRRIPQRRLGRLEDLEGALLFLCSEAARYVTGTELVVDGGHLVSSL